MTSTRNLDAAGLNEVRQVPLFAGLSDEDIACIEGGEIIDAPAGMVLAKEGQVQQYFYLALAGAVQVWRSYDRQDVLMGVIEPGDFMGEISILLETPSLATARVSKPARIFRLDQEGFWKMLRGCPTVAREILRTVAERFRNIEGFASQREKLISLGTMAAGLAHELNNPASAASRAASELGRTTEEIQKRLCELVCGLPASSWGPLLEASEDAHNRLIKAQPLDSLARSDREEALNAWFEAHQIADGWTIASPLVDAGLNEVWLENYVKPLPVRAHTAAVHWLAARLNLKLLLKQIETSSSRVSELVKAVKAYTHVDKGAKQEIDIHEGIDNTLAILGHKLKSVEVRRAYDRTLPRIIAYGGELNQVWTNLIDNAIDAVEAKGKICIGTSLDNDYVLVEIVDNGVGIPKEIQRHMFEPFFTTKGIGSGTGLGLVISHRIVADRHGGEIEFESQPGETRFKVRLPLRPPWQQSPETASR